MQRHYRENIHIEDLTRISHMSETHFRRKFGEYMNISPAEYVNLLRVKRACELLAHSDSDIADVGMQAGFRTTGAFIRNFKKFTGVVPREWRKTNSEVQKAEPAGTTSGGVSYEAGELVPNDTAQVRFPDKRQMLENDLTYALQAALDEIYAEGSQ